MKKEIEVASWFWVSQLNITLTPVLSTEQVMEFQRALISVLETKYENHWYLDEPDRGHAFRSILFENGRIDRVLLEAAKRAQINDLHRRLPAEAIMWVDPGHVSVLYKHAQASNILFDLNGSISSPVRGNNTVPFRTERAGLRISNLEPTVLHVNNKTNV